MSHVTINDVFRTEIETLKRQREVSKLEFEIKQSKYKQRIKELESTLDQLNNVLKPYICPMCAGNGWVKQFTVSEMPAKETKIICPECDGTGLTLHKKSVDYCF
jgi:DnaJ-class molecular chaperone